MAYKVPLFAAVIGRGIELNLRAGEWFVDRFVSWLCVSNRFYHARVRCLQLRAFKDWLPRLLCQWIQHYTSWELSLSLRLPFLQSDSNWPSRPPPFAQHSVLIWPFLLQFSHWTLRGLFLPWSLDLSFVGFILSSFTSSAGADTIILFVHSTVCLYNLRYATRNKRLFYIHMR